MNPDRSLILDPRGDQGLWTPQHSFIWEHANFTVPMETSEDRVQFASDKYRKRFGEEMERQGFTVLGMGRPERDYSIKAEGTTDPNRRAYIIWAKIRREPQVMHAEVKDEDIGLYEKAGFVPQE